MRAIPKTIHHIWLGGQPIPGELLYYRYTWMNHHRDWNFILWTEENLPIHQFINEEEYQQAEHVVLKKDIAQYEILNLYGGVYTDLDFECYKNIEPLMEDVTAFAGAELCNVIGMAIFACTSHHKLIKRLIRNIPQSIKENKGRPINEITGPVFVTKNINWNELAVYPDKLLFPSKFPNDPGPDRHDLFPDAYAIHHWYGVRPDGWVHNYDK